MRKIHNTVNSFTSLLLSILFLVGFTEDERINKLSLELESTQKQVIDLEKIVEEIREKDLHESLETIAFLTPGSGKYSIIKFDLGVLTVSIVNVVPYANGTKLTLRFGNTLASTINGLKCKIEYGKVDDKGVVLNETAKSKEVTFKEPLHPGRWTNVTVVLDGMPPAELGFVSVREVSHTGITLKRS